MLDTFGLLEKAFEARDLARRARRVAHRVTNDLDRERLLRYAAELEEQAVRMEAEAAPATRTPVVAPTRKVVA